LAADLDKTGAEPPLREHAPFVADAMLEWKIDYSDGDLGRWSVADLREFLLDWYPRKGDSEREVLSVVCPSVMAFLRFLDATGRLVRGDAGALAAAVARLRPQFLRDAADPRSWGPAKSMVMQMRAEGLDPADPDAVDAWVAAFNDRPQPERELVLGGARPASPRSGTADQRKARRKAAKAARKRSRR
jgi:hypothetical protein